MAYESPLSGDLRILSIGYLEPHDFEDFTLHRHTFDILDDEGTNLPLAEILLRYFAQKNE